MAWKHFLLWEFFQKSFTFWDLWKSFTLWNVVDISVLKFCAESLSFSGRSACENPTLKSFVKSSRPVSDWQTTVTIALCAIPHVEQWHVSLCATTFMICWPVLCVCVLTEKKGKKLQHFFKCWFLTNLLWESSQQYCTSRVSDCPSLCALCLSHGTFLLDRMLMASMVPWIWLQVLIYLKKCLFFWFFFGGGTWHHLVLLMHVADSPPPHLCHYTLEKNGACRKRCTQSLSRCRLGFGRRWCAEFCCCFVFVFLFCFCFFTFHSDVFKKKKKKNVAKHLTEGGLYSHNMQPCCTIYTFTHTFTHLSLKPFFFFLFFSTY